MTYIIQSCIHVYMYMYIIVHVHCTYMYMYMYMYMHNVLPSSPLPPAGYCNVERSHRHIHWLHDSVTCHHELLRIPPIHVYVYVHTPTQAALTCTVHIVYAVHVHQLSAFFTVCLGCMLLLCFVEELIVCICNMSMCLLICCH